MLENLENIPATACLGETAMPITDYVRALGGHWFSSESTLVTQEGDVVTALASRSSMASARRANGNNGPCVLKELAGQPFLSFEDKKNCGFRVDPVTVQSCLSLAIVFGRPMPVSGTLGAILGQNNNQTLVLRENKKSLQIGAREGKPSISLPYCQTGKIHMLFLTFDKIGAVASFVGGQSIKLAWQTASFPGDCTAFLACRRDHSGLFSTQGPNQVADFLVLPDIDIHAPQGNLLRNRLMQYQEQVFDDAL